MVRPLFSEPDPISAWLRAARLMEAVIPAKCRQRNGREIVIVKNEIIYRISRYSQTEVYIVDGANRVKWIATACLQFAVDKDIPEEDRMIAEYLLLENDEHAYWQTAGVYRIAKDIPALLALLAGTAVCLNVLALAAIILRG